MKTTLKFLPAFFAASVPVSMAAEFAGLHLPSGLDTVSAVSALTVTLFALTAVGDYARPRRVLVALTAARTEKAAHPLAA